MSFLAGGVRGILDRRQTRRARLPWDELEAEAARQGCSPADIFFDRAGLGDPNDAGGDAAGAPAQCAQRAAWRGHDPLPAPRTG